MRHSAVGTAFVSFQDIDEFVWLRNIPKVTIQTSPSIWASPIGIRAGLQRKNWLRDWLLRGKPEIAAMHLVPRTVVTPRHAFINGTPVHFHSPFITRPRSMAVTGASVFQFQSRTRSYGIERKQ